MRKREWALSPEPATSATAGDAAGISAKRRRITGEDKEILRSPKNTQNVEKPEKTRGIGVQSTFSEAVRSSPEKKINSEDWKLTCRFASDCLSVEAISPAKSHECSETAGSSKFDGEVEREEAENMASTTSSADPEGQRKMEAAATPAASPAPSTSAFEKELENFFAMAEKKERERFTKKYNFDVSNDRPLDGRYEWSRVEP